MAKEKKEKYVRPTWDEYFMELTRVAATRSTCDRGRGACLIVRDNYVLVMGYIGSPKGFDHCDDVGHLMKKVDHGDGTISNHCVRTIHSEQNAITQAARLGVSIDGATVYTRKTPCRVCSMLLINCGIKRVVIEGGYHQGADDMLKQAGIEVKILDEELVKYKGMTEKKEK